MRKPTVKACANPARHVEHGGQQRGARRLVGDLARALESAVACAEMREDVRVLRRRAELEHKGLDVGDVRDGTERAVMEGGKGTRLAASERALERELLEGGGGVLRFHGG